MRKTFILMVFIGLSIGCVDIEKNEEILNDLSSDRVIESTKDKNEPIKDTLFLIINEDRSTIRSRFNVPEGCIRTIVEEDSFANYLRNLPLKNHNEKVMYYNGNVKENSGIYEAVVDMDIGTRDLQQCADAIMRLRGEYLFNHENYESIHFNLTNGFKVDYSKWIQGNRVIVEGDKTYWKKTAQESKTYEDFRKYMNFIFTYAGTLSLSQELESVEINNMQIGDIFIQGGSPGHAVIVVDMAENVDNGERYYMLAQSYMPAQDIQILVNPKNHSISPWYTLNIDEEIISTPEWRFTKDDLKRFKD